VETICAYVWNGTMRYVEIIPGMGGEGTKRE
jgi:hypothetical protein